MVMMRHQKQDCPSGDEMHRLGICLEGVDELEGMSGMIQVEKAERTDFRHLHSEMGRGQGSGSCHAQWRKFLLFPRATSQAAVLARIFGDCREGQIPKVFDFDHALPNSAYGAFIGQELPGMMQKTFPLSSAIHMFKEAGDGYLRELACFGDRKAAEKTDLNPKIAFENAKERGACREFIQRACDGCLNE